MCEHLIRLKDYVERVSRRTSSKDLREDALLVAAVDVVRSLPGLVRPVQQAAIFGVSKEQLGQATAPTADGDVEGSVSFLEKQQQKMKKMKSCELNCRLKV